MLCKQLENLKLPELSTKKLDLNFLLNDMQLATTSNVSQITSNKKTNQEVIANKEKLLKCIKYHQKIIEIKRKIQSIFSATIFLKAFFSQMILCTTAFVLTIISPKNQTFAYVRYIVLMIIWLIQIFFPCYYSQRVESISGKLSALLFHSDWTLENAEYRKIIIIFVENTKKPLKFSAFKFFPVNLETFVTIANSAFSLYAVFKKVY